MNQEKRFIIPVLLLACALVCRGSEDDFTQNRETGVKYYRNYLPSGGDISPQNWTVLQDRRGVIYVGNQGALLEYDGVSWRTIRIRNRRVRSMAIDPDGNIYIGGYNEIGRFSLQPTGTLTYLSFLDYLPADKKKFSVAWKTHYTEEGIYFRTTKYLFRFHPDTLQLKIWEPNPAVSFKTSFTCRGELYIRQNGIGLTKMTRDAPYVIPGGEIFKDKIIYMLVPYGRTPGEMLIGTRENGLFLYREGRVRRFFTGADDYIKTNKLYHGIRLEKSPGQYAIATRQGGVVIIDAKGSVKYLFNTSRGLANNLTRYLFEDAEGNIWLALNKGIAKIEYASPFFIYNSRTGPSGMVLTVAQHRDRICAGTSTGIHCALPGRKFVIVPGIVTNCWRLLSTGDSLLAATSEGVFRIQFQDSGNNGGNRIKRRRITTQPAYALVRDGNRENRVWLGTGRGLAVLNRETVNKSSPGPWKIARRIKKISREIRTIAEDSRGGLWLGSETPEVIYVAFPSGEFNEPEVTVFNRSHGLPDEGIRVFNAAGRVWFASPRHGLYTFDAGAKRFVPDTRLGEKYAGGGKGVYDIAEDSMGRLYFHSQGWNYLAVPLNRTDFEIRSHSLGRLPVTQVNHIFPARGGGDVWFAASSSLIRYTAEQKEKKMSPFSCLIRRVLVNGTPLFYDSKTYSYLAGTTYTKGKKTPVIPYRHRNLVFHFAAASFQGESRTRYRCRLDGLESDWSEWSPVSFKEYTNIDPGLNRFRVQARNAHGQLSREAVFRFRVLYPWYNSWWAYLLFLSASFFSVYLIVKLRGRKLEQEKQKLEVLVDDRTREINEKNVQLEEQTETLKNQSEKLRELDRMKSRFFSNISHEFRTPLTLIMGPLEQLLAEYEGKDEVLEKRVKLMLRNSQRLLTLINRLLDLSRLDSGKMKLRAVEQNIVPFLKGIAASFELLANQYQLNLSFRAQSDRIPVFFDPEKMEDVMCNILVNAVKFTPPGGEITVAAKTADSGTGDFPRGYIEISVTDTGPGIPREQLARIFDRFYQLDSPIDQKRRGSGIGLALTRELVQLHRGRIDVHSRESEPSGTEFIICLPLGDSHLEPHQVIAPGEMNRETGKPFEIPPVYIPRDEIAGGETRQDDIPANGKDSKEIILVVEDNADVREYIRGALEPVYSVKEAATGEEGITIAGEIIPDLVISDIMMPGIDGFKVCKTLKNKIETSHIPVILLTAKASEQSIVQGLEAGADDYITKPFSTTILTARIKNLIDLRRHFQLTLYREMTRQPVKMTLSRIDREFIGELQDVIEKNLAGPDFNVEALGKKLYMSRATLYRKIHALSGESPGEFIQSYRLKRGAELLKTGSLSILEIALEVGFSSASYFTKCFKKKFNQLPSEYQGNHCP